MKTTIFRKAGILTPLVKWYQNTYKLDFGMTSSYYQKQLAENGNDLKHLAIVLIIDNHQWYLKIFTRCQPSLQKLIEHLVNLAPWEELVKGCSNFDELYQKIEPLQEIKYVGQLTYYDIALRMVKMYNRENLMPAKTVYLHARPMTGYRWLYKAGYVKEKPACRIDYDQIKADFPGLSANEIEDVMCHFVKLIPSEKIIGKKFGKLSQKEAANIIDGILKGLCQDTESLSGKTICGNPTPRPKRPRKGVC